MSSLLELISVFPYFIDYLIKYYESENKSDGALIMVNLAKVNKQLRILIKSKYAIYNLFCINCGGYFNRAYSNLLYFRLDIILKESQKICKNEDERRLFSQLYTLSSSKISLNYAASYGFKNVIDWWFDVGYVNSRNLLMQSNMLIYELATNNHLDLLKYVLNKIGLGQKFTQEMRDHAINNGCVNGDFLNWYLNLYNIENQLYLPKIYEQISGKGYFEMIKFLIDSDIKISISSKILEEASKTNQIEIILFWIVKFPELSCNSNIIKSAIESGNLNIIKFWYNQKANLELFKNVIYEASKIGNLDMVKFGLENNLHYSEYAIDIASQENKVNILKYLLFDAIKDGYEIKYSERAFRFAVSNNRYDVIKLWFMSGLKIKYEKNIIDNLCSKGNVEMLQYLYNLSMQYYNSFIFPYSEKSLDFINDKNIKVLNWFFTHSRETERNYKNRNIEMRYSILAFNSAANYGNVEVVRWWLNSGLNILYSQDALNLSSANGHHEIVKLILESNLPLKYSSIALDRASELGYYKVLKVWFEAKKFKNIDLKYTSCAIDYASQNNHIQVLNEWLKSGLPLKYTNAALDDAANKENIEVIIWWNKSKLELKYSERAVDSSDLFVIKWFYKKYLTEKLKFKYSEEFMINIIRYERLDILEWLIETNLPLKYSNVAKQLLESCSNQKIKNLLINAKVEY